MSTKNDSIAYRKEELGRAKARNIDGENHHVIFELRQQVKTMEAHVAELKGRLAEEVTAKAQIERQWTNEAEIMQKRLASQIPQLAAAATQRYDLYNMLMLPFPSQPYK
jgi:TolA-binding protein